MTKRFIFYIALALFIFSSCSQDEKTRLFTNYLSETFDRKLGKKENLFVIIDFNACKGCVNRVMRIIEKKQIIENENCTIIFCSQSKYLFDGFKKYKSYKNVLFDIGRNFFSFNLSPYSHCFILTNDRKVQKLVEFDYRDFLSKYEKLIGD